ADQAVWQRRAAAERADDKQHARPRALRQPEHVHEDEEHRAAQQRAATRSGTTGEKVTAAAIQFRELLERGRLSPSLSRRLDLAYKQEKNANLEIGVPGTDKRGIRQPRRLTFP